MCVCLQFVGVFLIDLLRSLQSLWKCPFPLLPPPSPTTKLFNTLAAVALLSLQLTRYCSNNTGVYACLFLWEGVSWTPWSPYCTLLKLPMSYIRASGVIMILLWFWVFAVTQRVCWWFRMASLATWVRELWRAVHFFFESFPILASKLDFFICPGWGIGHLDCMKWNCKHATALWVKSNSAVLNVNGVGLYTWFVIAS